MYELILYALLFTHFCLRPPNFINIPIPHEIIIILTFLKCVWIAVSIPDFYLASFWYVKIIVILLCYRKMYNYLVNSDINEKGAWKERRRIV